MKAPTYLDDAQIDLECSGDANAHFRVASGEDFGGFAAGGGGGADVDDGAVLAVVVLGFVLYRRLQQKREHYP